MPRIKAFIKRQIIRLTGYNISRLRVAVIEPTNTCSCVCPICGAAQADGIKKGFMEWKTFVAAADQIVSMRPRQVCLYNRGESMLHERIYEMTEYLSSRGLFTELVTNGEYINPESSMKLLNSGLNRLVISYPGITAENYLLCRGKELKDEMADNIEKSISVWSGSGKEVFLRSLVINRAKSDYKDWAINLVHPELPDFLRRWISVKGLSMIEVHGYMPWAEHYDEKLLSHLTTFRKRCSNFFDSLVVFWDGTVTPCSYDVRGELSCGMMSDGSLGSMYNSAEIKKFRKSFYTGKLNSLCANCLIPRYPVPLKTFLPEKSEADIAELEKIIMAARNTAF